MWGIGMAFHRHLKDLRLPWTARIGQSHNAGHVNFWGIRQLAVTLGAVWNPAQTPARRHPPKRARTA